LGLGAIYPILSFAILGSEKARRNQYRFGGILGGNKISRLPVSGNANASKSNESYELTETDHIFVA